MFDPKEVEAYRKISAPADLRERVLSSYADIPSAGWNPYSMLRMASSVAACLVLVIVLSVFTIGRIGDASVSVSGESLLPECSASVHPEYGVAPLSVQPIAKSMTPSVSLPITLTLAEKTVISVSDGALSLMGDGEETVSLGSSFTADGQLTVNWCLPYDGTQNAFVMTLRGTLKSETLILSYDEWSGEWTLNRKTN